MSEMIERVARAISNSVKCDPCEGGCGFYNVNDVARAAIEAHHEWLKKDLIRRHHEEEKRAEPEMEYGMFRGPDGRPLKSYQLWSSGYMKALDDIYFMLDAALAPEKADEPESA